MRNLILALALLGSTIAQASYSPATRLFDFAGTGVSSQANGSQRALDVGLNVAGVQIDPRTRIWNLSSGADSCAAVESGIWNITNITGTISLPSGAATAAKQPALGIAGTASADVITVQGITSMTALKTDGSAVTQPISAVALPLPGGAATSANQTNGSQASKLVDGANTTIGPVTTLSGINYLPVIQSSSVTPGSTVAARSTQIAGSDGTNAQTLSVDTGGKLNLNNISGTISLPSGASTATNQATANTSLASIDGKLSSLGQKAMTASAPVVLSSDQSAIPATQSGTWTVQQGATPTTVANAWPIKVTDGVNTATLKAASTASAAADPSIVVALSPNTQTPPMSDFAISGTLTAACASGAGCAAGSTVPLSVNDLGSAKISVSGTWAGTIVVDLSTDNFTTFASVNVCGVPGVACTTAGIPSGTIGYFTLVGLGAVNQIRARMSVFTSGSATVKITGSQGNGTQGVTSLTAANFNAQVVGNVASGATDSGNGVKVAGLYSLTPPTLTDGQRGDIALDAGHQVQVSLGSTVGKTVAMKTGVLTTTATTADQVVLTYTVTTGKTLYLEYFEAEAFTTVVITGTNSGIDLGDLSLENPSGTKLITNRLNDNVDGSTSTVSYTFSEPVPIAAGTVIRCVTTPTTTTSIAWRCNFGGYEK